MECSRSSPCPGAVSRVSLLLHGYLLAEDGRDLVVHERPGHVGVLQGALLAARAVDLPTTGTTRVSPA